MSCAPTIRGPRPAVPRCVAAVLVLLAVAVCGGLFGAGTAWADGPAGADPTANIPIGAAPAACDQYPMGAECIAGFVVDLDRARADLGLSPYRLPADFAMLAPAQQALVLADLDRIAYGLPPITGLTAALSGDAAAGVKADYDPSSSDPSFGYWTANWAGGYPNMVMAYYDWMYDDGPGSGNLDCTTLNASGCWGHRHDILWQFDGSGSLAMGAAAGVDPAGSTGYAMLLGEGDGTYRPSYTYTWSSAVAAGALAGPSGWPGLPGATMPSTSGSGTGGSRPAASASTTGGRVRIVSLRVRGRSVRVIIAVPAGARSLACALTARSARGWRRDRFVRCATTTVFTGVRAGRYRLRVRVAGGTAAGGTAAGGMSTRTLAVPAPRRH